MAQMFKIVSPAEDQAEQFKSNYGLENHGLTNLGTIYWNLTSEALYEEILFRREGQIAHQGPIIVKSGKRTARAASDKFIVREPVTENHVDWGSYNHPTTQENFDHVFTRLQGFFQGRDVFVQDAFVGADRNFRMPIRVITQYAWQSLFARNMFILPKKKKDYQTHEPEFTLIVAPSFEAVEQTDHTRSSTFVFLNFDQQMCIIGDTGYAGEIKKSIFSVLNYYLPLKGVMTMHSSANVGPDNDVAVFFGLSGTGKTTLSADPTRRLIGDDEHGWSDEGIFNFENGCYAKVINLSKKAEPQIYATTQRFGTILENVGYDPMSRQIDLNDDSITENTRASYPLDYIENAVAKKRGGHPQNIIFLTCDAEGVLPPIAKLDPDQAIYQFISGYTSKIAGTETGIGKQPVATFSACFGAPFMVHSPLLYAEILKQKIIEHKVNCWLLNTGWVGGPYGIGKRISIRYTRTLLNAALSGELLESIFYTDPVFGFEVPKGLTGVPEYILRPVRSWNDKDNYWKQYYQLAERYIENFKKFEDQCPEEIRKAGPQLNDPPTSEKD
jgi:phosphoenolpyruvate carboxykinase (ATP)